MQKPKKRIYIPDIYMGLLILPVIGIIAMLTEFLLPWITALIDYFKK
jgi:hypothetical protein